MKKQAVFWSYGISLAVWAVALLLVSCEISSPDDVTRQVLLNVTGSYQNGSGIADRQSGTPITLLAITQRGDQLTAVDNLGARWTGTIGRVEENLATVTLRGLTNTGVEVVITGTILIEGTTGTLRGTWIEPDLRSAVSATASSVQPVPTPVPTAVPTAVPGATATPVFIPTLVPGPIATSTPTPTPSPGPTPTPTPTPVGPPPPPS